MKLRTIRTALTVGGGVKALLATTGPLQGLFDRPGVTHEFCNRQALTILRRDGFVGCANFFQQYLPELTAGVYWADEGWKNVGHYFQAGSEKGLWRFPSAIEEFRCYFGQALSRARQGNSNKAAFFLGAAAHLVQDLCVPHHARAKVMAGHQQYEGWAQENFLRYAVDAAGIYHEDNLAHSLILKNAAVSADFLDWVGADAGELAYHNATAILLPRAQQTTAGLLLQFFTAAGAILRAA
ncbi:MAG: zinc dependent phospholipase C family protein [Negativicutes bacterium]|nr:zinc dependent phospholipase C family protein [Negativicutes bacterium]